MSGNITVRLWPESDLKKIKTDKKLATVFMNGNSFSEKELAYYPYSQRRQYEAVWYNYDEDTGSEPIVVRFYATDDQTARWFLGQQYTEMPDQITEMVNKVRSVKVSTIKRSSNKRKSSDSTIGRGR